MSSHAEQMKRLRTTMSDEDLCEAVMDWVCDLCTRKRTWLMSIPVDVDRDPDTLIAELVRRFRDQQPGDTT